MATSRTSSESPGSAPSTKIGPVIGCGPGPRSVTPRSTARSEAGISASVTPASSNRSTPRATIVSTRTRSPDATRSAGLTRAS
jgi:hypothetical protein